MLTEAWDSKIQKAQIIICGTSFRMKKESAYKQAEACDAPQQIAKIQSR